MIESTERKRKKIVFVISDIDKALSFEWTAADLQQDFDLVFLLLAAPGSQLFSFLKERNIRVYEITNRNFSFPLIPFMQTLRILNREKPDIVHTHLWYANLLGLLAAWLLRIKKRIYTRHHSTLHYTDFPSGRKWDVWNNYLATHIVAISKNVKGILLEWDHANPAKIRLIYHGFDWEYFQDVTHERIENLKTKYKLKENGPIIGVISRYMERKGIQYVIPAFKSILRQYPNAKLVLANARGNYEPTIRQLLKQLPLESYVEIKFEADLAALYQTMDVFVHVPTDPHWEAFGQTYVEALMAGVPSVFTKSGIAHEFIQHKQNAMVVDYKNTQQIEAAVLELLSNAELRRTMTYQGKRSTQVFLWRHHLEALKKLYAEQEG